MLFLTSTISGLACWVQNSAFLAPSTPQTGCLVQPSCWHFLFNTSNIPSLACSAQNSAFVIPSTPYVGCLVHHPPLANDVYHFTRGVLSAEDSLLAPFHAVRWLLGAPLVAALRVVPAHHSFPGACWQNSCVLVPSIPSRACRAQSSAFLVPPHRTSPIYDTPTFALGNIAFNACLYVGAASDRRGELLSSAVTTRPPATRVNCQLNSG